MRLSSLRPASRLTLPRPAWSAALGERIETVWNGLAKREQRVLLGGAVILLLVFCYLALWEPAVTGRKRLAAELPQLREQAAQMTSLAQEARTLSGGVRPALRGEALQAALTTSLASRGLKPRRLSMTGETVQLQLDAVPFGAFADWLGEIRQAQRLNVSDAQIRYVGATALVNVTVTLQAPAAPGH